MYNPGLRVAEVGSLLASTKMAKNNFVFGLKIFVQTFKQSPFALSRNFCHPDPGRSLFCHTLLEFDIPQYLVTPKDSSQSKI